jgi:membrane protein YdbS with pleckstrin-like domain
MAIPDNLADGELRAMRLHPHGKTMLRPAATLALILAVAIAVILILPASASHLAAIRLAVGAAALVAALYWFGVPYLRWRSTTYELTTRRLSVREGVLTRSGRDFPLTRISDVSFSQGPVDRLLGCGKLIVETAGEHGQLVLDAIPDVKTAQATLFQLVGDEHERIGRTDGSADY